MASLEGAAAVVTELQALKSRLDLDYRNKFVSADRKMKEQLKLAKKNKLARERKKLIEEKKIIAIEKQESEKSMACKMSPDFCN